MITTIQILMANMMWIRRLLQDIPICHLRANPNHTPFHFRPQMTSDYNLYRFHQQLVLIIFKVSDRLAAIGVGRTLTGPH